MATVLDIIVAHSDKVAGIKVSLLDKDKEIPAGRTGRHPDTSREGGRTDAALLATHGVA